MEDRAGEGITVEVGAGLSTAGVVGEEVASTVSEGVLVGLGVGVVVSRAGEDDEPHPRARRRRRATRDQTAFDLDGRFLKLTSIGEVRTGRSENLKWVYGFMKATHGFTNATKGS